MIKVLVTPPVNAAHKAVLESVEGCSYTYCPPEKVTREMVLDSDILFGNVAPKLISGADNLKLLQLFSAGTDGYIPVLPGNTLLTNTTGAFGLAISEHMLAMLLTLMKRLHQYRDNQREALWLDRGNVRSVEGSTVLVIGLGDIGSAFAKRVKALGAYTVGVRRKDISCPDYMDEVHLTGELDALLPQADVVAMALPGTPETRRIMDAKRLHSLKEGAIVLNVGRGSAIDLDALAELVAAGRLKAGLDVTDPEPLPGDHPLWKCEDALITPHISGFFHLAKTLDNMVDIAAYNIRALMEDRPLKNIIDLDTGYRKLRI